MNNVWVITYLDKKEEPQVMLFNNPFAANACYDYFYKKYRNDVWVDKCDINSSFTVVRNEGEYMLSQENINKLHMNGIYRCKPVLDWIPSYKWDNPYWCKNWTFKVKEYNGRYAMYDTYWATGDDHPIELTDENFDKFEYLFDLNDIQYVNSYENWLEYPEEDRWRIPLDSGGTNHAKYVVRRGAKKIKERVVERIQRDIDYLRNDLTNKERMLNGIIDGSIDPDLY